MSDCDKKITAPEALLKRATNAAHAVEAYPRMMDLLDDVGVKPDDRVAVLMELAAAAADMPMLCPPTRPYVC